MQAAKSTAKVTSDEEMQEEVNKLLPENAGTPLFANSYGYRSVSRIRYIPVSLTLESGYDSALDDFQNKLNLMVPLFRTYNSIGFLNADASLSMSGTMTELNVGAVYRYLGNRAIYGVYGYYNRKDVNEYRNSFEELDGDIYVDNAQKNVSSAIFGLELLTRYVELRSNYYYNYGESDEGFNAGQGNYIVLPSSNELLLRYGGCSGDKICQLVYDGFDAEIGFTIFESVQLYASYYYFYNSRLDKAGDSVNFVLINDDNTATYLEKPTSFEGYRIRSDISLWRSSSVDLQLQLSYSDDNLRGSAFYGGLKVGFTFGRRQKNPDDIINDMRNAYDYLTMKRNNLQIKIAQNTVHSNNVINILSINNKNFTTGLNVDMTNNKRIYFADLGATEANNIGTWDNRTTLQNALDLATDGDVIFIISNMKPDGSYEILDESLLLDKNVQLQGNGSTFVMDGYEVQYANGLADAIAASTSRFDIGFTNGAAITTGANVHTLHISGIEFYNHAADPNPPDPPDPPDPDVPETLAADGADSGIIIDNPFIDTYKSGGLTNINLNNNKFVRVNVSDASQFVDLRLKTQAIENANYTVSIQDNQFIAGLAPEAVDKGGITDLLFNNHNFLGIEKFELSVSGDSLSMTLRGINSGPTNDPTVLSMDRFIVNNMGSIQNLTIDNLHLRGLPDASPQYNWELANIKDLVIKDSWLDNTSISLTDTANVQVSGTRWEVDNVDGSTTALLTANYTENFQFAEVGLDFSGGNNNLSFKNSAATQGVSLVQLNMNTGNTTKLDATLSLGGDPDKANNFELQWDNTVGAATQNVDLFRIHSVTGLDKLSVQKIGEDDQFGLSFIDPTVPSVGTGVITSVLRVINEHAISELNLDAVNLKAGGFNATGMLGNISENLNQAIFIGKQGTTLQQDSLIYTDNVQNFSVNNSNIYANSNQANIYLGDVQNVDLGENNTIGATLSGNQVNQDYSSIWIVNSKIAYDQMTIDLGINNNFTIDNYIANYSAELNMINSEITVPLTKLTLTGDGNITWKLNNQVTGSLNAASMTNVLALTTKTINEVNLEKLVFNNIDAGDIFAGVEELSDANVSAEFKHALLFNAEDADKTANKWMVVRVDAAAGASSAQLRLDNLAVTHKDKQLLFISTNIGNFALAEKNLFYGTAKPLATDFNLVEVEVTANAVLGANEEMVLDLGFGNIFAMKETGVGSGVLNLFKFTNNDATVRKFSIKGAGNDASKQNMYQLESNRIGNSSAIAVHNADNGTTLEVSDMNLIYGTDTTSGANVVNLAKALQYTSAVGNTSGEGFVDINHQGGTLKLHNLNLETSFSSAVKSVLEAQFIDLAQLENNQVNGIAGTDAGSFQLAKLQSYRDTAENNFNLGKDNQWKIDRTAGDANQVINGLEFALAKSNTDSTLTLSMGSGNVFLMAGNGATGLDSAIVITIPETNKIKSIQLDNLSLKQTTLITDDNVSIDQEQIDNGYNIDDGFGRGLTIASSNRKNAEILANSIIAIENNLIKGASNTETVSIRNGIFESTVAGIRALTFASGTDAPTASSQIILGLHNNRFNILTNDATSGDDLFSAILIKNNTDKNQNLELRLDNNEITVGTGEAGTGTYNGDVRLVDLRLEGDQRSNLTLSGNSKFDLTSVIGADREAVAIQVSGKINGVDATSGKELIQNLFLKELVLANNIEGGSYAQRFADGTSVLLTSNLSDNINRGLVLGINDNAYFVDATVNGFADISNNTFANSNKILLNIDAAKTGTKLINNRLYANMSAAIADSQGYKLVNWNLGNIGAAFTFDASFNDKNILIVDNTGGTNNNVIFENLMMHNVNELIVSGNLSNKYVLTNQDDGVTAIANNLDVQNDGDPWFKVTLKGLTYDNVNVLNPTFTNIARALVVNGRLQGGNSSTAFVEIQGADSLILENVHLHTSDRSSIMAVIGSGDADATKTGVQSLQFKGNNSFVGDITDAAAADGYRLADFHIGRLDATIKEVIVDFSGAGNSNMFTINNLDPTRALAKTTLLNLDLTNNRDLGGALFETLELAGNGSRANLDFTVNDYYVAAGTPKTSWSTAINIDTYITNRATMAGLRLNNIYLADDNRSAANIAGNLTKVDRAIAMNFDVNANPALDGSSNAFVYVNDALGLDINSSTLLGANRTVVEYVPNRKADSTTTDLLTSFTVNQSTIRAYLADQSMTIQPYYNLINIVDMNSTATSLTLNLGSDLTVDTDSTNNKFIIENVIDYYNPVVNFVGVEVNYNITAVTVNSAKTTAGAQANQFTTYGLALCGSGGPCSATPDTPEGKGNIVHLFYRESPTAPEAQVAPTLSVNGATEVKENSAVNAHFQTSHITKIPN